MKKYNAPQAEVISFDKDYDYVVTNSSAGTAENAGASVDDGVVDSGSGSTVINP